MESDRPSSSPAQAILLLSSARGNGGHTLLIELKRACHNQSVRCSAQRSDHLISRLDALLDGPTGLAWLRSIARRQKSQPWQPVKCGPSLEPASVHLKRFKDQWAGAVRAITSAYPATALDCAALLALDPLRPDSDHVISAALAAIRRLSDPGVVRSMEREAKRDEFGKRALNSQERARVVSSALGARVRPGSSTAWVRCGRA
jgi:hypothetical protein